MYIYIYVSVCVHVIFILTVALSSVRIYVYTESVPKIVECTRVLKLPGCIQGPKVCLKFFFYVIHNTTI